MTEQMIEAVFIEVLNMSLTAGVIILAVLLARIPLKKVPRIYVYALWGIVLFRLLCPVSFESGISLLGVLQNEPAVAGRMEYIPQDIGYQMKPKINLPIEAANNVVNSSLPPGNPAGSVNAMQIILYLAVRVWILGMAAMIIYSTVSVCKFRKQLKSAVWVRDNIYSKPTCEVLGSRKENLNGNGSPFVYGIIHPRIYVPENLSEKELEYILLHEQIHIRRGDHIFRMLAYIALCIHWFNPLVWAAFSFSGRDMEISCDEAVIRRLGNGIKKEYSASLLNFANGSKVVKGIPVAFGESDTGSRIKHVLKYQKPAKLLTAAAAIICVILAVVFVANPSRKDSGYSVCGVVTDTYNEAEGKMTPPLLVKLPRVGEVLIPDSETITTYAEGDEALKAGDLIKITFSEKEVDIQETSPASFSQSAENIEVKGRGFAMNYDWEDRFSFALPIEMAPGASASDTVEIYFPDSETGVLRFFTSSQIFRVTDTQVWITLSFEETEAFLESYSAGARCTLISRQSPNEKASLTGALNPENPEEGIYSVSVRSISKSARCIDRYVSEDTLSEQEELYFADNCSFFVNEEMASVQYKEVTFDEFADYVMWDEDGGNVSCSLTMQNGLITKAEMLNPLNQYGISYEPYTLDSWYDYIEQTIEETEGVDALDTYFTLVNTITSDISFEEGDELVEVYTGNIGDGDSGIVLFKNARGELLHSEDAHSSRADWNNIYIGEDQGISFIMTVHIEDRDTYGEYRYQVYRIGLHGVIQQIAGTRFEWGDSQVYDDELFKEWVSGMEYYLKQSNLVLSSQEGEIRTENICEIDRYNYETLKRE